eukprot:scaffold16798_cov137-Skeletonema_menzelii.AAC.3
MLCPLDVNGAHHHGHQAFVSTPIIIDTAIKQQYRVRRSSRLEYSKDHENDINIWLPTEHIASATASSNIAKTSHGWDNFPTSIDNTDIDDNYNIIDDWVDAKKRQLHREQEKVEEWRRSRKERVQSASTSKETLIDETTINDNSNSDDNVPQSSSNINRLDLPYNDISQLSAIQSNAPAILLPSGPGTGNLTCYHLNCVLVAKVGTTLAISSADTINVT